MTQPLEIRTISLAYLPTGALLAAAIGGEGDPASLRAAKAALLNLAMQVDAQLLRTPDKSLDTPD